MQGLYFTQALNVALSNILDRNSKVEYPKEPFRIFPMTEQEIEEKQIQEAIELKRRLDEFSRRFNERDKSK